jgi:D-alanine--poly(phosphoribitol) ligase subunit 2
MMTTKSIDREGVVQVIYEAMDELRESGVPTKGPLRPALETPLFGSHGLLDSLGLVQLIVFIEDRLATEFGAALTLADDKALSEKRSPFRTVDSLADYVVKRLAS